MCHPVLSTLVSWQSESVSRFLSHMSLAGGRDKFLAWSVKISHGNGLVRLHYHFCEREEKFNTTLILIGNMWCSTCSFLERVKKLYPNESKHGGITE